MAHTVGLITDSAAALIQLRQVLGQLEHSIVYTLTADQVALSRPLKPSIWVLISEEAADVIEQLSLWSEASVFLAEDIPDETDTYYNQWKENLIVKLLDVLANLPSPKGEFELNALPAQQFKDVWVLASSLGGPEAIKEFLATLKPDLPVAFIYAQHIDMNFDKILPQVVGKNSSYEVSYAGDGDYLQLGHVKVMPSHQLAELDARGRIHIFADKQWDKPYTPNINQIIENIGRYYSERMGVIIFSGMCDDGAEAAIQLSKENVPIWAQTPEDCVCSAMPQAVIDAKIAKFVGDASSLAKHLNNRYGKIN